MLAKKSNDGNDRFQTFEGLAEAKKAVQDLTSSKESLYGSVRSTFPHELECVVMQQMLSYSGTQSWILLEGRNRDGPPGPDSSLTVP